MQVQMLLSIFASFFLWLTFRFLFQFPPKNLIVQRGFHLNKFLWYFICEVFALNNFVIIMAFQLNFLFKATKDWIFHEHEIVYFKIFFVFFFFFWVLWCHWHHFMLFAWNKNLTSLDLIHSTQIFIKQSLHLEQILSSKTFEKSVFNSSIGNCHWFALHSKSFRCD